MARDSATVAGSIFHACQSSRRLRGLIESGQTTGTNRFKLRCRFCRNPPEKSASGRLLDVLQPDTQILGGLIQVRWSIGCKERREQTSFSSNRPRPRLRNAQQRARHMRRALSLSSILPRGARTAASRADRKQLSSWAAGEKQRTHLCSRVTDRTLDRGAGAACLK